MKAKEASANAHKGHRENVRRRYLAGGLEVFAPHEILEFLLYYSIPRRDTNPIAHRLLDTYGSLSRVLAAPVEELQTIEGVGERTAALLSLTFQISRWMRMDDMRRDGVHFQSAQSVGEYLQEVFEGKAYETVYELCLNRRGDLLMSYCLTNGNICAVSTDIRLLVKNAMACDCAAVIIAHNHPGGDALPSDEDITATRAIEDAFRKVNIKLYDHIIVGSGDFVSLRESGFFRDRR